MEMVHLFKFCQQAALHLSNRYLLPWDHGLVNDHKHLLIAICPIPTLNQGGVCKDDSWSWITLGFKTFSDSQSP